MMRYTNSVNDGNAQGFLLLTLPNCTVSSPAVGAQTGILALQCVTLDIPSQSAPARDVWLVINFSRSMHTYMFLPDDERADPVQLTTPPDPSNPLSYQDLETMEVILSQYGIVHDLENASSKAEKAPYSPPKAVSSADNITEAQAEISAPSDLKGCLVLMDEDDGQVVATLDDTVTIKEDRSLTAYGHEKDPVVIHLPEEAETAGHGEAYVHTASAEDQDMLMRTAGLISRGIMFATSTAASGLTSASNYYISHSVPTSNPVEFSPRTRANIKKVHKISGTAVAVTAKTTGAILKTFDHVVGRLSGPDATPIFEGRNSPHHQLVPPPLPMRPGSPGAARRTMTPATSQIAQTPPSFVSGTRTPPPLPPRPRLLNRLLASTDLLITTLEHSAKGLMDSGTDAVSVSLAHKYGRHVGDASKITGQSIRNVGLVYIDVRGVGRRALLKRAGVAVVKARVGGREVVLGHQAPAGAPLAFPSNTQPVPPPRTSQAPSVKGSYRIPGDRTG